MRLLRGRTAKLLFSCWAFAAAQTLGLAMAAGQSESKQYVLEFTWRVSDQEAWTGRFSVNAGEFLALSAGVQRPSQNARLSEGCVTVSMSGKETAGGFSATVKASPDSQLVAQLESSNATEPLVLTWPLDSVAQAPVRKALGGGGFLDIRRVEEDKLRLRTSQEQLIFPPGSSLDLQIEAALPEVKAGAPLDIVVEVLSGGSRKQLWQSPKQRLSAPVIGFASTASSVPLPYEEGVYTVRVSALKPPGSMKAWLPGSSGTLISQRMVDIVIFDDERSPAVPVGWRVVQSINPTTKRWWNRLPKWVWMPRPPWLPEGPLGSSPARIVPHTDGKLVQLPAAGAEEPHWQAYPIPIAELGKPYLVEVEYPDDAEQQLVLSLIDQDSLGSAGPLGASSAAVVGEWESPSQGLRTIRRLFWPRSNSPLLVLSNGAPDRPARYGRIRVLASGGEAPTSPSQASSRQMMARVSGPELPWALGESIGDSSAGTRWSVYLTAARRLADWVLLNEQDGAVVTVESADGILYPSNEFLSPSGKVSSLGDAGLPSGDALELLFREFDRRGLRITPSLRFETRLAEFPAKPESGYSPLDESTQQAMAEAVAELRRRYGRHPSFAGVAVEFSPQGYALPPSPETAVTLKLFQQFLSESRLAWPTASPLTQETIRAAVAGPWNRPWRDWTARRMSACIEKMAHAESSVVEDRRLFLLVDDALVTGPAAVSLRPRLGSEPDSVAALQEHGLDANAIHAVPDVQLVQPRYLTRGSLLPNSAIRLQANAGFSATPPPLAVSLTRPTSAVRLSRFEAASPFGTEHTSAQLSVTPHSVELLDAYGSLAAQGGAQFVIEGGGGLSLVLDQRLIGLRRAMRLSPESRTTAKTAEQQPLVVRSIQTDKGSLLEVINPSPWNIEASVTIRAAQPCQLDEPTAAGASQPLRYTEGEHVVDAAIGPYEMRLLQFDASGVEAIGLRSRVAAEARAELRSVLADIRKRNLNSVSVFNESPNLSFEQFGFDGAIVGWEAIAGEDGAVTLTKQEPDEGNQALRLLSKGNVAGIRSQPFTLPRTGQLAMVFRVRGDRLKESSRLDIFFEQPNGGYRSETSVQASQLADEQGGWRPYVFSVNDLPLAPEGPLRVRFELRGGGRVDIDNLEMYDLLFPLEFLSADSANQKLELLKTIHSAEQALDAGRLSDCRELLRGYWPSFVRNYTPLLETPADSVASVAARDQTAVSATTENQSNGEGESETEENRGFQDRIKGYLPGFLRF